MYRDYLTLSVLFVLAAVPLSGLATPLAPLWDDMQVKHTWRSVPENWESIGHPPAGTTIDLHIALKPQNESALIDALYAVSDPRLPTYGAHLSREQVAELVAPRPDTLGLIHSWLKHGGVSSPISVTHGGGWLAVTDVPVSQANDILGASYQLYRHAGTNHTILRTVGYALPAALHGHVQMVAPTTYFSPPRIPRQTPRKRYSLREKGAEKAKATSGELVSGRDDSDEDEDEAPQHVTLEFLRWLYSTQTYVPAATDRNKFGIPGFEGQYASQVDLTEFMNLFRTEALDASFKIIELNDDVYDQSDPGEEANLNIQYAEGLTYPTPHIFYSVGGTLGWSIEDKEPMANDASSVWLNYLLSQPNDAIPQTISISYGNPEIHFPEEYTTAICDLYARLGARGVSILAGSGDDGVGKDCKLIVEDHEVVLFRPLFPASCPWVTSVGGTTKYEPEEAASLSGGGFSIDFPRPAYQDGAVTAFLNDLGEETYKGLYNPDGRGIPDIAAQALKFLVVRDSLHDSELNIQDGTSCSAPTAASVISLLNDHLLANGKAPLGFLNIWLYDKGLPGLTDIISGSNPGCGTEGFSAVDGWDPVTGLGTPDFEELQDTLADRPVVSSIASTLRSSTRPTPTPTS